MNKKGLFMCNADISQSKKTIATHSRKGDGGGTNLGSNSRITQGDTRLQLLERSASLPKDTLGSGKNPDKVKQGKKNRLSGADFERRTRENLEECRWIVAKWPNNVDLVNNKLVPAKHKFNFYTKVMSLGTGFPDFIAYQFENNMVFKLQSGEIFTKKLYEVIGVECKVNGKLDKEEKEKCQWLLEQGIFSKILIAHKEKVKNKVRVIYEEFK